MNVQNMLQCLDRLYDERKYQQVESFLTESLETAKKEGDEAAQITILSELSGYYRENTQYDKAVSFAKTALLMMRNAGMDGTMQYAAALLNAANALRAAGEYGESMECYRQVFPIYEAYINGTDFPYATLYNNLSLLYQASGDYDKAADCLSRSLDIVKLYDDAVIERAVTYTNLGATLIKTGKYTEALENLKEAEALFERDDPKDYHYSACMDAMGEAYYMLGCFEESARCYETALKELDSTHGRNRTYEAVKESLDRVYESMQGGARLDSYEGKISAPAGKVKNQTAAADVAQEVRSGGARTDFCGKASTEESGCSRPDFRGNVSAGGGGGARTDFCGNASAGERGGSVSKLPDQKNTSRVKPDFSQVKSGKQKQKYGAMLDLCQAYYETYGKPMIESRFSAYSDRIAVGLMGEGSDCLGFDDELSRDHDCGPGFCMWMSDEIFESTGKELNEAYAQLPTEFGGVVRKNTPQGKGRTGAMSAGTFYRNILNAPGIPSRESEWAAVEEWRLRAATSGRIFYDPEGTFTKMNNALKAYYPDRVWLMKLAEALVRCARSGQYNYGRMMARGEYVTAKIELAQYMKDVMRLVYLLNRTYAPYGKWLHRGMKDLSILPELYDLLRAVADMPDQRDRWDGVTYDGRVNQNDDIAMTIEMIAALIADQLKRLELTDLPGLYLADQAEYILENEERIYPKMDAIKANIAGGTGV